MACDLADWTAERIETECADAYVDYSDDVRKRHIEYFAGRPSLRSEYRGHLARTREAAFPQGWEHLAGVLDEALWHRHHLSAGSSQVLAVALLAAAVSAEPTLSWLPGHLCLNHPLALFEVELAADVLHERPRQTALDCLLVDRSGVVAAEAKFTERGFGRCSCKERERGACSDRVLERPYWDIAASEFGFRRGAAHAGCRLSLAYQAVRNVAAAQAIAGPDRAAMFLLLYDARNPYFAGGRAWPGWVEMLSRLMKHSTVAFEPLSWQELLGRVQLDERIVRWAWAKHGLKKPPTAP